MRYIFIGPDCAGKSTLAELFADKLNLPIFHNSAVKSSFELMRSVLHEITRVEDVVLDRFQYPDDIIYKRACGDLSSRLCEFIPEIERELKDNTMFIYVHCSESTLMERLEARGDDDRTAEEILRAAEGYVEFIQRTTIPVISIWSEANTPEQLVKILMDKIKKNSLSAFVTIPREKYYQLEEESDKLNALELTGVDNWDGYDIAMEYLKGESEDN